MANVYTAGSDRRLIIYSISRYIFLRTAYIDGIERPIMLVSDFLDGLSDVVLGDTIYYAYQNQNGDILVKISRIDILSLIDFEKREGECTIDIETFPNAVSLASGAVSYFCLDEEVTAVYPSATISIE